MFSIAGKIYTQMWSKFKHVKTIRCAGFGLSNFFLGWVKLQFRLFYGLGCFGNVGFGWPNVKSSFLKILVTKFFPKSLQWWKRDLNGYVVDASRLGYLFLGQLLRIYFMGNCGCHWDLRYILNKVGKREDGCSWYFGPFGWLWTVLWSI